MRTKLLSLRIRLRRPALLGVPSEVVKYNGSLPQPQAPTTKSASAVTISLSNGVQKPDTVRFGRHVGSVIASQLMYVCYEYKALRIYYRQTLLTELRAEVKGLRIHVTYGVEFSHVVSENEGSVSFIFTDGTKASADILIGADGIHSTVRKCLFPDVVPKYSGSVAITCALIRNKLELPSNTPDYPMPVAIHDRPGAFVMAPQNVEGSEVLAGTQRAWPEQDRAGWDALLADREGLLDLFKEGYSDWPTIVQSALDNVDLNTLSIWPYYVVPKLDSWSSIQQRVVILGDAAHAIPPTAGQGASQGFEDAFTLATILSHMPNKTKLQRALPAWKEMRQQRVDKVIELTQQLNNARLPQVEREKLAASGAAVWQSGDSGELGWLYNTNVEEEVLAAIETESRQLRVVLEFLIQEVGLGPQILSYLGCYIR